MVHFGECGFDCGEHGECEDGACICVMARYDNCNGDWSDGCEADLGNDDDNCTGCGLMCPDNSFCSYFDCRCEEGFADCDWVRTSYTLPIDTNAGDYYHDGCECPVSEGWICDRRFAFDLKCCIPNPGAPCETHQDCCGYLAICNGGVCDNY